MKLKGLAALFCLISLAACTKVNEDNVTGFQSLSQEQQAQYWQAQKIKNLSVRLEHMGVTVYQVGDEWQLIIPANLIFIKDTQAYQGNSAKQIFQAIANLLNAQSMPSIKIEAYANMGSNARNFALSQSWANTLEDQLRQAGVDVGVIYTAPHGQCDNIGKSSLNNRLEIHYRISHDG